MKNKITVVSPTRVDLAGGTLDMWPLFNFVSDAKTINVAIDIYTKAAIEIRSDSKVIINSPDLKKTWEFDDFNSFYYSKDKNLFFYHAIFSQFEKQAAVFSKGFSLTTSSDSPIGGGLGGSSSLMISILKALHEMYEMTLPDAHGLVHLAHNIEAEILRTPTGTQDYYPAVTGGLSIIHYTSKGIEQEVKSLKSTPFSENFLLVYTGKSHHSGLNNFEVLKSAVQADEKVLNALIEIKKIAEELNQCISDKKWEHIPMLFNREFAARIQLTPAFSSPEIEKLSEICLAAGAMAVKICGAGGGGCVLVWVSPENRERVVSACQKEKFQCLNAKPVEPLI